jgi:quinol monooxygenase YgiN
VGVAIGAIFDGAGITQAQYEQVRNEVAPGNKLPTGMTYHAAGPTDNGWCVIEVWESQEAAEAFFRDKLGDSLQRAGISVQPRFFQVANIMQS